MLARWVLLSMVAVLALGLFSILRTHLMLLRHDMILVVVLQVGFVALLSAWLMCTRSNALTATRVLVAIAALIISTALGIELIVSDLMGRLDIRFINSVGAMTSLYFLALGLAGEEAFTALVGLARSLRRRRDQSDKPAITIPPVPPRRVLHHVLITGVALVASAAIALVTLDGAGLLKLF